MEPIPSQPGPDLNQICILNTSDVYRDYIEPDLSKAVKKANEIYENYLLEKVSKAFEPELLMNKLLQDEGDSPHYRRKLIGEYKEKKGENNEIHFDLMNGLKLLFDMVRIPSKQEEELKKLEQKKTELTILKSRLFNEELPNLPSYQEAVKAFDDIEKWCQERAQTDSSQLKQVVKETAAHALDEILKESGEFLDPSTQQLIDNPVYVSYEEFPKAVDIVDYSTAMQEQLFHLGLEQPVSPVKSTTAFDVHLDFLYARCQLIEQAIQDVKKKKDSLFSQQLKNENTKSNKELVNVERECNSLADKDPQAVLNALESILKEEQQKGGKILKQCLDMLEKTVTFEKEFEKAFLEYNREVSLNSKRAEILTPKHPLYTNAQKDLKQKRIECGLTLLTYQNFLDDQTIAKIQKFIGLPSNVTVSPKVLNWRKIAIVSIDNEKM